MYIVFEGDDSMFPMVLLIPIPTNNIKIVVVKSDLYLVQ